jgi:hypothetical protein
MAWSGKVCSSNGFRIGSIPVAALSRLAPAWHGPFWLSATWLGIAWHGFLAAKVNRWFDSSGCFICDRSRCDAAGQGWTRYALAAIGMARLGFLFLLEET